MADEKAKTNKMQDKLMICKSEIENAQKFIEKLNAEKKAYKQKFKVKNSVIKQYEQQIQHKQESVEDQGKALSDLKKDNDKKELEVKDLTC